jgi:hypothetical protein
MSSANGRTWLIEEGVVQAPDGSLQLDATFDVHDADLVRRAHQLDRRVEIHVGIQPGVLGGGPVQHDRHAVVNEADSVFADVGMIAHDAIFSAASFGWATVQGPAPARSRGASSPMHRLVTALTSISNSTDKAAGGHDDTYGVGVDLGRGADLTTGPFPQAALRTGRASCPASGSPRTCR